MLNQDFWNNRYQENNIGWDIGHASTPLVEYIDQLEDKTLKILIPGCGNAYEGEYLYKAGFQNICLLDISGKAIQNITINFNIIPNEKLIHDDFFNHEGQYDLILEQTFFCALTKALRKKYVKKMHCLLKPKGKLVGLLFNRMFSHNGPPFGGSEKEYRALFSPYFDIKIMEESYNSIKPREKAELFIKLSRL